MNLRIVFACAALSVLAGCASIIDGSSQDIEINTTPQGASCTLTRAGETLGSVAETPGTIKVEKTKDDITVTCKKNGYAASVYVDKSGSDGTTLGNIILGGGIGWAVDSARGADNKYDTPITLVLSKR